MSAVSPNRRSMLEENGAKGGGGSRFSHSNFFKSTEKASPCTQLVHSHPG